VGAPLNRRVSQNDWYYYEGSVLVADGASSQSPATNAFSPIGCANFRS
jgi:hypothetical protein